MEEKRFKPKNLHKLNDPKRLQNIPPTLIIEKAQLTNPKTMLDFGTGTALFPRAFIDIFPKLKAYACDIAPEMIHWIEKEVKPHYPTITPIQLEDYRIPLPDDSIDFILMLNVFHELDDIMETLNECKRVMKPKGKFILSDWRKEKTPNGPSFDIRIDVDIATEQIEKTEMTIIEEIPNDLPNNYLIIAEK